MEFTLVKIFAGVNKTSSPKASAIPLFIAITLLEISSGNTDLKNSKNVGIPR